MIETDDKDHRASIRVLIVDDSPAALRVLKSTLEDEFYDVITAGDGLEAYAKATQFRPDLVITDNVMPMMDGATLLKKLRANAVTRKLPVIILTAEDPAHARPTEGPPPDAFIPKSSDMAPLLAEVQRILGRKGQPSTPDGP